MTITELVERSHNHALAAGWWEGTRTFGDVIALCHSELSEALEAFRAIGGYHGWIERGKPEGVPAELADCVIRIADLCGRHGIDLETAIADKLAYNKTRGYRHGGKHL